MPMNTGFKPDAGRVDIVFRCGQVLRDVDPKSYRWTLDDPEYPARYDYDIQRWQPSKSG